MSAPPSPVRPVNGPGQVVPEVERGAMEEDLPAPQEGEDPRVPDLPIGFEAGPHEVLVLKKRSRKGQKGKELDAKFFDVGSL